MGRILRKINSFCEILNKMSQKEGRGEGPSPSPPLNAYAIYVSTYCQGYKVGVVVGREKLLGSWARYDGDDVIIEAVLAAKMSVC